MYCTRRRYQTPQEFVNTHSPPTRQPLTTLSANSSFLFASAASPQPPPSPTSSLPPLSDDLPLLEDGSTGSPPTCPDCQLPLTVQEEDGTLLLHCSHCHHASYMSAECLFPPTAAHSGLGSLLSRPAVDETAESGQLSRTVSNLFGTNGRANSFIPMGDSLGPPSSTPSLASTLSFTAPAALPVFTTSSVAALSSSYPPMAVYDDSSNFSHSSYDTVSIQPTNRSMSNAFSAFSNNSNSGHSFTHWSTAPHPPYLSDREGAAVRHIASVSSHPVATMLQYEMDSRSGRPVSRPNLSSSSSGHVNNGYSASELVMEVPRERLRIDRHTLAVVPLAAATTPYYRLPDALTAPYVPVLPYTIAPPTRRYPITTMSPQSAQRSPLPASSVVSSSSGTSVAVAVTSPDLTPSHYVSISELHIDELCSKLAVSRGKLPSICRAALQHVMRQTECSHYVMQQYWQQQLSATITSDSSASHITKVRTSHAVALASAVFHYVYQRHVQRQNAKAATSSFSTTTSSSSSPPPARPTARSPVKLPQLEVAGLSNLIATSADNGNQYRITPAHLSIYHRRHHSSPHTTRPRRHERPRHCHHRPPCLVHCTSPPVDRRSSSMRTSSSLTPTHWCWPSMY